MISFTWEIIWRLLVICIGGFLAHSFDFPIRKMSNAKMQRFARYGVGSLAVLPALLSQYEGILDAAGIATDPAERRRMLWITTAAYFLSLVPFGIGVIAAHFIEQLLTGDKVT